MYRIVEDKQNLLTTIPKFSIMSLMKKLTGENGGQPSRPLAGEKAENMSRIPIIMDVDTGVDDAIAICFALAREDRLNVLGFTTVAGNVGLDRTLPNTLKVVDFLGKKVPVAKGAPKSMFAEKENESEASVHGTDGLGGAEIPAATSKPHNLSAVEFIAETLRNATEKVTLVPTGPLTNIAIFLMAYPELHEKIERIVLMGGAALGGNMTPTSEFNIGVDPEAAHIVFKSGIDIVMLGLDVTHKALTYADEVEAIKGIGNKASKFVTDALDFYFKHETKGAQLEGCPIHDACTIAYLIDPTIFTVYDSHVTVDIDGQYTRGCTVVDLNCKYHEKSNAKVVMDVDRDKFAKLLYESLTKLN